MFGEHSLEPSVGGRDPRKAPVSDDPEDRLLQLIYATALDPSLWPEAMCAISDHVGGSLSALTRLNAVDGQGESMITPRSDMDISLSYWEHFGSRNVFALNRRPEIFRQSGATVLADEDHLPWEDYQKSEYYNDFLRLQGVNAAMFIMLETSRGTPTVLNIGRPIRRGRFEAHDLEAARALQPHIVRAYRLGRSISNAMPVSRDLAQAMESSRDAMFMLDETGRVRVSNPPAASLLTADKGLTVIGGRLSIRRPEAARRLEVLVAQATIHDGVRTGGDMSLAVPGERFPLAISVAPIGPDHLSMLGRLHSAVVCVTELERSIQSPEARLRALFGLTQAEVRVATAVFRGLSLREAAEAQQISFNTARSHYARIYEKTGITRQAELVVMMMRLSEGGGLR